MVSKKVLVVGAGAAGLIAAGTAAEYGASVTLIEKNRRVGRKIMITGKGRCNITNNCDVQTFIRNVPVNGRFLYSAINRFSPEDTIGFFESLGLPLKTERGNRVFPVSERAVDVVDTLREYVLNSGVKIVNDTAVRLLRRQELSADRLDGRRLSSRKAGRSHRDRAYAFTRSAREQRPRMQIDAGAFAQKRVTKNHQ